MVTTYAQVKYPTRNQLFSESEEFCSMKVCMSSKSSYWKSTQIVNLHHRMRHVG